MRINLDFGHTLRGADTGAEGCGRREQDCTREIGYKVKAKLEALGHSVCVCSIDSASTLNESLSARVNRANENGGDLYVSIHLNAGGGHGTEVYTYQGRELSVARNVLNNICSLGYTNRGLKGARLYVVNHTNMPAMLIECCFIDSSEDMSKFNAEDIANAIVKGITGQVVANNTTTHPAGNSKIAELQRIVCVEADGIYGPETDNAIRGLIAGIDYRTPKLTKWIQARVGCNVDGIYGQVTADAVKGWQSSHDLVVDGIAGYNTIKSLALA